MDITVYDKLYNALKNALTEFNKKSGFNVSLSPYSTTDQTYPLIIFDEPRNVPISNYSYNREEISSLGYKMEIYAKNIEVTRGTGANKTKERFDKQQVCRNIMKFAVDFMKRIGVRLISNNPNPANGTQGEIYGIILVFQQNHNDKREIFI